MRTDGQYNFDAVGRIILNRYYGAFVNKNYNGSEQLAMRITAKMAGEYEIMQALDDKDERLLKLLLTERLRQYKYPDMLIEYANKVNWIVDFKLKKNNNYGIIK